MHRSLVCVALLLPLLCSAQGVGAAPEPITNANATTTMLAPPPVAVYDSGAARLLDQLKPDATQMPLWLRYNTALERYSKTYFEEKPLSAYASETGARQVGRLVDSLQNRLAALEDVETAARALYAALTPAQRKNADQLMLASVPIYVPAGAALCPTESDKKLRPDQMGQSRSSRHGGGMGNMNGPGAAGSPGNM